MIFVFIVIIIIILFIQISEGKTSFGIHSKAFEFSQENDGYFADITNKQFTFVMNGNIGAYEDKSSRICKLTLSWNC